MGNEVVCLFTNIMRSVFLNLGRLAKRKIWPNMRRHSRVYW